MADVKDMCHQHIGRCLVYGGADYDCAGGDEGVGVVVGKAWSQELVLVLVEPRSACACGVMKSLCLWSQEENPDRGHSHGAAPLPPFAIGIEPN